MSAGNKGFEIYGNDTIIYEKHHPDSLRLLINNWFKDNSISWDDLLIRLDSLKQNILKENVSDSLSLAFIIHKKGVVYYYKGLEGHANDFYSAIKYYSESIRIRMSNNTENNKSLIPDIIKGYNNIGGCYLILQQPYKALENLLIALQLAEDYPARDEINNSILSLNTLAARTLSELGDYDNALLYYSKIIHFRGKENSEMSENDIDFWKIRALIETGGIQAYYLNMQEKAIANLNLAQEMLRSKKYPDGEILLASSYHDLAIAWKLSKDYYKSLHCYNQSIAINRKLNRISALADDYLGIGNLLIKMKNLNGSEQYLLKAGKLYSSIDAYSEWSYIYDNLGDAEFEKGNFIKSLEYDNLALKYLLPDFIPESVYDVPKLKYNIIPDKHGFLISLTSKANTFLRLYQLGKDTDYLMGAYSHFILADTIIGLIRSEFTADASKMTLVQLAKPVYEKAIETCWELYNIMPEEKWLDMAFRFSEKSRAIVLLDAVRKIKAGTTLPANLLTTEKKINLSINYFEKQLVIQKQKQHLSDHEKNLIDTLLSYKRKYTKLLDHIKTRYPEYFNLIYDQNIVGIEKIRDKLSNNQSLIEYFVGDSNIFIFCISGGKTLFIKNIQADSVRLWVNRFNKYIQDQDMKFSTPAYNLYNNLIPSIEVKDSMPVKLILIPDDVLSSICFEALITCNPSSNRILVALYKNFFIYKYQVCYAFSATTMVESYKKKYRAERSYLGIAPTFKQGFSIHDNFFDELSGNITEVRQIRKIMGGKKLLGKKATKSEILRNISDYSLIHFATHALANDTDGNFSYLILGPDESDLVYVKDLYALDLNANLVVLSACQTASGTLNKGEGIISLARGFIYSGSSAVVTSLWDIRENINKDIILDFYKGIRIGLSIDRALREAKLKFLESVTSEDQQYAHPYFWAPLICIGTTAPYQAKKSNFRIWLSGSLVLLFLLFWLFRRHLSVTGMKKLFNRSAPS